MLSVQPHTRTLRPSVTIRTQRLRHRSRNFSLIPSSARPLQELTQMAQVTLLRPLPLEHFFSSFLQAQAECQRRFLELACKFSQLIQSRLLAFLRFVST